MSSIDALKYAHRVSGIDTSKYAHSPVHAAILAGNNEDLKCIFASFPCLCSPNEILTEADALAEEQKAEAISALIDCRDVPHRETPLHLAVRLRDATAAEMLMGVGADWSLQNEQGWSALQEAICMREEGLATIIVRHCEPLAWAKWCRRLPRLIGTMRRMRDFYMEITFHFESSVIPFISRIAPSDTYKIWKRGSNLRADMTLAGFDGFKIQRSDQSILFLGDGSEDEKVPRGSLCMIYHKDKEMINALDGGGKPATDAEIQQEVSEMLQTSIFRPGIDVTQAVLYPQLTWRRQEKTEMVGQWKAKVYDMHHVIVSLRSRRVPGAMTDEELFSSCIETDSGGENYDDLMTEDEKKQLEVALDVSSPVSDESDGFIEFRPDFNKQRDIPVEAAPCKNAETKKGKKGWFSNWGMGASKVEDLKKTNPPRSSLCEDKKVSNLLGDSPRLQIKPERHSVDVPLMVEDNWSGRDKTHKKSGANRESAPWRKDNGREKEYKMGLRPVLWLSPDFPLQTEELLPLLDILANKVKAVRRLRELLTTKLPPGTFPVKVAIPVVPTIRVLVTFTKFEELQPLEEFSTPPSSPDNQQLAITDNQAPQSSSWFQWIKTAHRQSTATTSGAKICIEDVEDPFTIPSDYSWITVEEKKKRLQQQKDKSKKGSGQNQ